MHLHVVDNAARRREFLLLPLSIYRDDPHWIRPLDQDVEAVFDPRKNKLFRHGECIRWVLVGDDGKIIGRVAAFVNRKTAKGKLPVGGMGFFDCTNSREAAFKLFDACRQWLEERGMQAMDGPVNFGERDSWWGLIVDGFNPPPYKMNYNPPYYRALFEQYGFKNYFEQWCYSLKVANRVQEKFYRRHEQLSADPGYRAEYLRKSRLDKYADDFRVIYNKAWARHGGGKELGQREVRAFFRKMKPVIDEQIIWFVYYNDEPVATWINLPDINHIFAKFSGKLNWFNKLRFMYLLKTRYCRKFIGLVFGVVPEHQSKGVDSFIIVEGANHIQRHKLYDDFEMQWIGDFNPKMVSICESLGTWRSRTLITYRYLFDREMVFDRHPVFR